eukprot:TRINITY_DN44511_c0_g1_i1.p1 TRINITY_DN44511_c0_g1~~TRINITY_DN44511_c0_g1_i1.p1  ORF type:complete len:416 (+),score=100.76 TRINITY_DN44511_c0_g1_i1:62-1249(+)
MQTDHGWLVLVLSTAALAAAYMSPARSVQPPRSVRPPAAEPVCTACCARARAECRVRDAACGLRLSGAEWQWRPDAHPAARACGLAPFGPERAAALLKSRAVMFIGDSVSRLLALSVFALLCNHKNMLRCGSTVAEPNLEAVAPRSASDRGPLNCTEDGEPSECMSAAAHAFKPLPPLTSTRMYRDRHERRVFWARGISPPARLMRSRGAELWQLAVHRPGRLRTTIASIAQRPGMLPQLRAVVVNVGFHLRNQDYAHRWWDAVAESVKRLRLARPGVAVVWAEQLPHSPRDGGGSCSRRDNACARTLDRYRSHIASNMTRNGAVVAPLASVPSPPGHLRAGDGGSGCEYSDRFHPTVHCMYVLTHVLLSSLAIAWNASEHTSAHDSAHWPVRVV